MHPWLAALLAALLAAAAAVVASPPAARVTAAEEQQYRLPQNVIPQHYRISIRPQYLGTGILPISAFTGDVVIEAVVESATQTIELHKGPTINHVHVICVIDLKDDADRFNPISNASKSENDIDFDSPTRDDVSPPFIGEYCSERDGELLLKLDNEENEITEKFIIKVGREIQKGRRIRIVLSYDAEFPEGGLTGFYVSTYDNVGMLTTKFEPTHARKAFPCFDEPALKATFDLLVAINNETDVISNMKQKPRKFTSTVEFETTPKMSPYLLAFIVYEKNSFSYTALNPRPTGGAPFQTWGRKDVIDDEGLLSQIEGPASLDFLEKYTNISYSETMTKMDMVAIPDFQSGAMENWGLVTYRESALLYSEESTTAAYKRVFDVIAHELAHMWFGNLVTTEWWSTIWLNEGFAEFLEYLVANNRYPKWRMLERLVLDEQMSVFAADAEADVSALTNRSIASPVEIGNHFGSITYNKGASILRQINNIMGEENFKQGVRDYLRERELNSATPADLFRHLQKYKERTTLNDTTFTRVLTAWTEKRGYPLVTVSRSGSSFTITQERFLLVPNTDVTETYPIYLSWVKSNDEPLEGPKTPDEWILESEETKEIIIENISSSDWVLFNAYQGGYYRVNYDDGIWNHLERELDDAQNLEKVAPIDRAALVDNALNLARAGKISYLRAFRVLRFLRHDVDFAPWAAARTALAHLQRMLGHEQAYKDFVGYIIEKAYNDTDFTVKWSDAHLEKVHRTNVLSLACSAGYEPCIARSRELLEDYTNNGTKLPADLESVVFCYGLKDDEGVLWNRLWSEYSAANAARRAVLTTALGCINHRDTLKTYLQKSLSDEVRSQDAYTVFSAVYSSPDGVEVALDFLTFWGYEKLDAKYGAVRNAMSTLISGLSSRLTKESQLKQLENAVEGRHSGALKTVQSNIDWLETHKVSEMTRTLEQARSFVVTGGAPVSSLAVALALLCGALLAVLR